jgi:hypothetical protein
MPREPARISHPAMRGTVAADSPMSPALCSKNDFDVLIVAFIHFSSRAPDSGISQAQLAIHETLHHLATKTREKCGLEVRRQESE